MRWKSLLCAAWLTAPLLAIPPSPLLQQVEEVVASVSEQLKPAVVHLEVWSKRGGLRSKSLGSGLLVAADGTIVTNHHVVDKAEQIQVILDDKSRHDARILRDDRQTDLAVLRISAGRDLAYARLGDSDKVRVGQWVLAIGNPYGLDRTVSFGIISGKGRYIPGIESGLSPLNDFLQTDALIDPGSSGGPLVDLQGRVLGINSAGIGRGIGFTIPAKVVQEVLSGRQTEGRLERGWLGLYPQPLTRELARHLKIPESRGIVLSDLAPGSPAESAGIQPGDILLEFQGQPVGAEQEEDVLSFAQSVSRLAPGQKVQLTVLRQGKVMPLSCEVGLQPGVDGGEVHLSWGLRISQVTPFRRQQYRLSEGEGLVVVEVESGSPAEEAGIEEGDVLLDWEQQPVRELQQLRRLDRTQPGNEALLLRLRKGQYRYYALMQPRGGQRQR